MALDLKARISLDGSGFEAGLTRLKSLTGTFAARVGALFSVGAVAQFVKATIDWGSQINDVATQLGVTKLRAQELSFAAKQSGADIGNIVTGLTRLQDAVEVVRGGGAPSSKMLLAFQNLGISLQDIASSKPDQLLEKIARHIADTGVNSRVTASMLDVFGRSGGTLIPMLSELTQKLQEFKDLGLGVSDQDLRRLDELGDKWDTLILKVKEFAAESVSAVGKGIQAGGAVLGRILGLIDKDAMIEQLQQIVASDIIAEQTLRKGGRAGAAPPPFRIFDDEEERTIDRLNMEALSKRALRQGARRAPSGDALTSIGNFLGSGGPLQKAADAQTRIQTSMDRSLKAIERNTSHKDSTLFVPP